MSDLELLREKYPGLEIEPFGDGEFKFTSPARGKYTVGRSLPPVWVDGKVQDFYELHRQADNE